MIHYKRRDYPGALALLDKSLNICFQRSVGRLPYYLLQSHKAAVLSAQGSHEKSHDILEDYIPSLNTATTNPLGDLELIETGKIVSHLLVISLHNLAVQLANLKRWDKAIEISARVLSLADSGLHQAQPVSRHFVYSHSASLRMGKTTNASLRSFLAAEPEPEIHQGKGKNSGSLNSSMDADTWSLNSSMDGPTEGRWNKWLSLAGQGRAVAPILIELTVPEVSSLPSLDDVPKTFKNYLKVLEAATDQFPKLDRMEVCPEEVLGTVSRAIVFFVDEASYSNSEVAAAERYGQIEKLLDEDLFEFCGQLRWDVKVYGILAKAYFYYNRLQDYENTVKNAQWALDMAKEQEGSGYHVAVCKLCIGACLIKAGQHEDAFSIGKEALTYCHGLSDAELQESNVRIQMEDILVGASHLMALAHIFLGNGKVSLKLSKIAKEHIKNTRYYGNRSSLQYTQISRVYEIAMSMNELVKDKNRFQSAQKQRGALWVDKISDVVPTKFVPGALHRNLPELYPERNQTSRRSHSAMSIDFILPAEEIVQEVVHAESCHRRIKSAAHVDSESNQGSKPKAVGRRYGWTGRYAAALNASSDQTGYEDPSAIASVSMTAPLSQHSSALSFLDHDHEQPRTGYSSTRPSRMQTSTGNKRSVSRARTASTPYGELLKSGVNAPPNPSMTGHQWVDELMHGKEEVRKLYAADSSSNMYFAKVYAKARDQNALTLNPLNKVMPKKQFVVGDHLRPQVGGARGPPSSGSNTPHLLRDWGPDPTLDLRRSFRHGSRSTMSGFPQVRSQTSLGLQSERPNTSINVDVSGSTDQQSLDSFDQAQCASLKLDMNELRVMKHMPYDSVVLKSAMGLFVSKVERNALLQDVDRYSNQKHMRPITATEWSAMGQHDRSRLRSSQTASSRTDLKSVSRPWYWSHAPEPSPFLHSEKGNRLAANKSYRVLPYGESLTPAAKQAYGTNGMVPFGTRSMQHVEVPQQDIVASAELGRKATT